MMQNSETHRTSTKQAGDYAEQIAREYLENKGYEFVEKNFRYRKLGEIDIVMRHGATLVFVEVRHRTSVFYGSPEASITPGKQRRIRLTASAYLLVRHIEEQPCRFDVVAVDLVGGIPVIRHLTDCM